jgi:hypothetical protein
MTDQMWAMLELLTEMRDAGPVVPEISVSKAQGAEEVLTMYEEIQKASRQYYYEAKTNAIKAKEAVVGVATEMSNAMTSALMSMIDGTFDVTSAFKNMASAIISELLRILVVEQTVRAIAGSFGGVAPASASTAGARAGGGTTGSGTYLVGEHGPELLTLPGGSYIDNKSSGDVTVNVVNQSGIPLDVTDFQQSSQSDGKRIVNVIIDALGKNKILRDTVKGVK